MANSKNRKKALDKIQIKKLYSLEEASSIVKDTSTCSKIG